MQTLPYAGPWDNAGAMWQSRTAHGSSGRAPSIGLSGPAPRPESRVKTHLVLLAAFAALLLSDRLYLKTSTGGRGLLPVVEFIIPAVAAFLVCSRGGKQILRAVRERQFALWLPCVALLILLPVLGILATGVPVRLMLGSLPGIRILSFMVFGAWIAARPGAVQTTARRYLVAAVVLEFIMAGLQYAAVYGPGQISFLRPFYQWDQTTQLAWGNRYLINGRSIGTFVNPNSLGFASVLAFWASALALRGAARRICVPLALGTIFLSQSRGSMFALSAGLLLWMWNLAGSSTRRLRAAKDLAFFCFLSLVLVAGWAISLGAGSSGAESSALSRFGRGLRVLSEGASADQNAGARVEAWGRAFSFYQRHPLGTWIEPQFLFGGYIDNEYVRLLLQGSVLLVFTYGLALYGGIRLIGSSATAGRLAAVIAAGVAVNSISAIPLLYPAMGAYWLTAGFYLAAVAGARERLRLPALRHRVVGLKFADGKFSSSQAIPGP
jgi:hypothetical protein